MKDQLIYADPVALRQAIRAGKYRSQTAGQAPGRVQGNVAVLPKTLAHDFLRYCQNNPKPCPVLAVTEAGSPMLPTLGEDIDIRMDVPKYWVHRSGVFAEEVNDLKRIWDESLVAFVLGCSFSFEEALMADGIRLRYVEQGKNVAMYRTNIPTVPAGPFHGPMVVSMRPLKPVDAIRAIQITSRFPNVHGAPVHFGDPAEIGIRDIGRPDFGDAVDILPGEVPVFWACGVTPVSAIQAAKPALSITHKPGCMLVTDLYNSRLAAI
jgi:uncharacterized protein YcsI (UPF0317 family)